MPRWRPRHLGPPAAGRRVGPSLDDAAAYEAWRTAIDARGALKGEIKDLDARMMELMTCPCESGSAEDALRAPAKLEGVKSSPATLELDRVHRVGL